MSLLVDSLPEFLGALGATGVAGGVVWFFRWRRKNRARSYTVLNTVGTNGNPVQHLTTRPPGTVITLEVNGRRERFELTDVRLPDGTFAAEPVDRYV
ncbi:hypothetical protein [Streptomyces muensis]|uniref:Uncharacterized protein n=1 Tax=Streptomyces muensis TaxID=1077944 RepID=A0A9X1TK94_STRM4|nr:hypothetical protein [Streptomyces muensis]MCF1593364.1 hypothetical protein [Streptomyces muensis]